MISISGTTRSWTDLKDTDPLAHRYLFDFARSLDDGQWALIWCHDAEYDQTHYAFILKHMRTLEERVFHARRSGTGYVVSE